jgi:hypothetical protein
MPCPTVNSRSFNPAYFAFAGFGAFAGTFVVDTDGFAIVPRKLE